MSLGSMIIKRILTMILTLIIVSMLVFGITQILPGDVAFLILGRGATDETLEIMRERLGLNRPIYVQYIDWFTSVLSGDLGESLLMEREIFPILRERLVRSLYLSLFSFAGVILFGIGFGILSAIKRNSLLDYLISTISYLFISVPEFVSGSLLILLFAGAVFNIFPASGYGHLSDGFFNWLRYLILPSLTLLFVLLAYIMRMTRTNMLEVMNKDYVRTAYLKGLSEKRIVLKHILKNAMLPTITLLGINLAWLIGGIVVTETVFDYPGIGRLTVFAIHNRDIPLIQATVLTLSFFYIMGSFMADLLYVLLNPKLRGD